VPRRPSAAPHVSAEVFISGPSTYNCPSDDEAYAKASVLHPLERERQQMRNWSVAFGLCTLLSSVACGGGSSSSPTSPTPTAPAALTLSYTFDAAGFAGNRSFSFTDGGVPSPGHIDINVMANNFDRAVVRSRGTVLFDPSKVE
jgi:hypothetical protein